MQNIQATHTTPSGLGGSLNVIILSLNHAKGTARVRVVGHGKEWNGYEFSIAQENLKPIMHTYLLTVRMVGKRKKLECYFDGMDAQHAFDRFSVHYRGYELVSAQQA